MFSLQEIYKDTISTSIQNKITEEFYQEYTQNTEKYISEVPSTVQFVKNYKGPAKLGLVSVSSKKGNPKDTEISWNCLLF